MVSILRQNPFSRQLYRYFIKHFSRSPLSRPRERKGCVFISYPEFGEEEEIVIDYYHNARYFLIPEFVNQIIISITHKPNYYFSISKLGPKPSYLEDVRYSNKVDFRILEKVLSLQLVLCLKLIISSAGIAKS